jgi:hypothetical protein
MNISNRTLGVIGMIGSPFLFFETLSTAKWNLGTSAAPGICDLIYMIGWSCSIIGLMRIHAAGSNKSGKRILVIHLAFLSMACIWNVWEAIDPTNQSLLYRILDLFWPASNLMLLITGIFVACNRTLDSFTRWIVLIAGCWLPFAFIYGMLSGGRDEVTMYVTTIYSVISWFLLALAVYMSEGQRPSHAAINVPFAAQ